jgi:hypothetical protein
MDQVCNQADNQTDSDLRKQLAREQKDDIEASKIIQKFNENSQRVLLMTLKQQT